MSSEAHRRCEHNKEADILVEDGDAAQRARLPFRVVRFEIRVYRLKERSDEGCFPHGPDDGALVPDVLDCQQLARPGVAVALKHTLVVRDRKHNDGQDEPPSAEVGHQHRNQAVRVEGSCHVCGCCVGRGRHEARIDSHVEDSDNEGRARRQREARGEGSDSSRGARAKCTGKKLRGAIANQTRVDSASFFPIQA
jgi:hypothetical protein